MVYSSGISSDYGSMPVVWPRTASVVNGLDLFLGWFGYLKFKCRFG